MDEVAVARARGVMDALVGQVAVEHAAQVRQVELIAELCAAHAGVVSPGPVLPGQERLVRSGGEGTPWVAEHVATELAPQLRMSILNACVLVSESMDLLHRHPQVWAATQAGRVRVWQARQIAFATRELSWEAAGWVDGRIAPALGHLVWSRLKRKLAGLVVRADTVLAARQAARARAERWVRVRHVGDGTAFLTARTDSADAHRFARTLDQVAGHLELAGDTDPIDVLRAKAVGVLADPDHALALLAGPDNEAGEAGRRRRPRARAELVIHLAPGSPLARCEELGPTLAHQLQEWLGHSHVSVHPVVDLSANPAVDAYEIPDAIARITRWRTPFEAFPWSPLPSTGLDLDHTITYRHGPDAPAGQSCPDNLGPLSRRVHNAKTHAGWHLEQPTPGVFITTSRLGYRYRTDPTGSTELPSGGEGLSTGQPRRPGPRPPDPRPPNPDLVDYFWPPPRAA